MMREGSSIVLTEIRCSMFEDCGEARGPIVFNPGLNVILGSSHGSNSIGKSTFLLIIDFAFGGKTYAKNKETLQNVGPHTIDFAFEFSGTTYRFSRSPMDVEQVWRCDEGYGHAEAISLKEYCEWLSDSYGMSDLGGTFRSLASVFMRAYGKDNYNVIKPLQSMPKEREEHAVTRLLRLYGRYGTVDQVQKLLKEAEENKKTFNESMKRDYIAVARNKSEYRQNEKRLVELKQRISELERLEHDNLSDLDPLVAEQVARLKGELSKARRAKTRVIGQLRAIEADAGIGPFKAAKNFKDLGEFFPGVSLAKLEEIERFHEQLNKALAEERKEQRTILESRLGPLDTRIEVLEEEIKRAGSASNLTKQVLNEFYSVSRERDKLREANDGFDRRERLAARVKTLKGQKGTVIGAALTSTQVEVNARLRELNDYVCGEGKSTPAISLAGANAYSFGIPNDSGTGSQTRAMVLFDIVVLEQTPLPAICHDTVSLKQIADEPMMKLIDLYRAAGKQVFIALDKAESYADGEVPATVKDAVVLELSDGHELFGRSWAKKGSDGNEEHKS